MAERIRDTLARVEAELSKRVQALRDELLPLERELSEARRALAAVSPEEPPALLKILEQRSPVSPYSNLTIKQLAKRALEEHFPHGATAAEMLSLIRTAYDREIDRASFSPQLSRLREEGVVRKLGRTWRLAEQKNEPLRSGSDSFSSGGKPLHRNKQSPGAG